MNSTICQEMTDLERAQCMFWDMHKDAYGFRPRGIDTSSWTLEQFDKEFELLGTIIERQEQSRIASEAEASVGFEKRVADLIHSGAGSRETAIRWIHDAEESNGDDEYLCFLLGLPYSYFKKVV